MEEWQEVAYAKINLALHVRFREPDGFHRIETIFAFAEDGDRLGSIDSLKLAGAKTNSGSDPQPRDG